MHFPKAQEDALFVDEAPNLYQPPLDRDFGPDTVDIVMTLADDHRRGMMIYLAGYSAPMSRLMSANLRLLVELL